MDRTENAIDWVLDRLGIVLDSHAETLGTVAANAAPARYDALALAIKRCETRLAAIEENQRLMSVQHTEDLNAARASFRGLRARVTELQDLLASKGIATNGGESETDGD